VFLVEFDACFYVLWFQGEYGFSIEKAYVLDATLLSLKIGVCYPYDLV
jgi:hypothetical protein